MPCVARGLESSRQRSGKDVEAVSFDASRLEYENEPRRHIVLLRLGLLSERIRGSLKLSDWPRDIRR